MSFFSCDWILLIFLISRLQAEWLQSVTDMHGGGCAGRLFHTIATTPVQVRPFAKIAGSQLVPDAFAPEQLFIPRNDGRIIAGDGRCLATDGHIVHVAPCVAEDVGQRWDGAFINRTNEQSEDGQHLLSRRFAGRCTAWVRGGVSILCAVHFD
eukprot:COSAG01_NODE_2016_length_8641_cov_6.648911_3_plen_153_part_00